MLQISRRAAQIAYIVSLLVAVVIGIYEWVAYKRLGSAFIVMALETATFFLSSAWITWRMTRGRGHAEE